MEMPISQILLLFAVFLVGLIILAIGLVRKKRTVEVVGISLLIAVLIAFFVESQEVRDILVSFAIVSVAILSALSIAETRRLRQGSIDRESRDRRERLLNEIIEWASNVAKSAISRQTIDVSELWEAKLKHKLYKSKGKYINVIVSSSFKELSDSFKDANIKLDEAIDFLESILSGKGGNVRSLKDYETAIADSVEKLLEEVAKRKSEVIK